MESVNPIELYIAFSLLLNLTQLSSYSSQNSLNSLSNNKIFYWSKLKPFADDNLNVIQKLKFDVGKIENIVEKGENAGYQCPIPTIFSIGYYIRVVKSQDCVAVNS